MWPAAIVALAVGGPLGACLFLAAAITHLIKVRKVDAEYAKNGQTPPSWKLVERWLENRKAKGAAPQNAKVKPYGSWAYAKQRWQAFWEDLGERHRETRTAYKKAVEQAKAKGTPPPRKPGFKESLTGWKWQIDQVGAPTGEDPAAPQAGEDPQPGPLPRPEQPDSSAEPTLSPRRRPSPHPQPAPGGPFFFRCLRCGHFSGRIFNTPDECQQARARHVCQPATNGDSQPGSDSEPEAATPPTPQPQQGEPVSTSTQNAPQQSGEVTGLMSAINYADAVAAAHDAHSLGGGEQYRASLGQAEVGPETIQSAATAQEASETAAGAWRAHAAKLREQLAAKEATTAETGTKQFLLNE